MMTRDLEARDFVCTLGDVHLYSNHFRQVATRLSRTLKALPLMKIKPSVTNLSALTFDDLTLEGYEADASIAAFIVV